VKTHTYEPENVFDDLDRSAIAALIDAAADIVLAVDEQGLIVDLSFGSEDLRDDLGDQWRNQRWSDTVTEESRDRLDALLKVRGSPSGTRTVQDIHHRLVDGSDMPIRYCAIALPNDALVAVVGRDLRAVAALQQQLLNAQLALEQDYWRLRQVETRYRLLFQMASDPLLIIDESTHKVLEANPIADRLLGTDGKTIVGKDFPVGFDKVGDKALDALLTEAAAVGRASIDGVRSAEATASFTVAANLLRQDNEARFLLRLTDTHTPTVTGPGEAAPQLGELLRLAPDAVVLTDADGNVLAVNQMFLELAELASEEQAVGRSVSRWLGRTGVDLNVLLNNLRQHDAVKLFATTLRGEYGTPAEVEISASVHGQSDQVTLAFFIRDIGRRLAAENALSVRLPKNVEQITQQVGRVPLKELVRQSTDLIEKLCIEAALELTSDNRASAAELLGVSRQGLYAKLNRYKLGDKATDE